MPLFENYSVSLLKNIHIIHLRIWWFCYRDVLKSLKETKNTTLAEPFIYYSEILLDCFPRAKEEHFCKQENINFTEE
jgi:hypothetical protein